MMHQARQRFSLEYTPQLHDAVFSGTAQQAPVGAEVEAQRSAFVRGHAPALLQRIQRPERDFAVTSRGRELTKGALAACNANAQAKGGPAETAQK